MSQEAAAAGHGRTARPARVRALAFYATSDYRQQASPTPDARRDGTGSPAREPASWLEREVWDLRGKDGSSGTGGPAPGRYPQLDKQLPDLRLTKHLEVDRVHVNPGQDPGRQGPDRQLRGGSPVALLDVVCYLFRLQVPVEQPVVAFEFTLDPDSLEMDDVRLRTFLRHVAAADVEIDAPDGRRLSLTDYVFSQMQELGWVPPNLAQGRWLAVERHQLVLIDNWPESFGDQGSHADEERKRRIVHRLEGDVGAPAPAGDRPGDHADDHAESEADYEAGWDDRPSGAEIRRPVAMNLRPGTWCGVLAQTSVVIGRHSDAVMAGICLTVVQAVGTAARFQTIWNRAFDQASTFQREYQDEPMGSRPRKALEELSDELGNLEFELAFNVGTAADLGLRIPSARIDDFHHALFEALELRQRVLTVGEMFIQARNSVRSELTAIESREMRAASSRTLVLDVTYGLAGLTLGGVAVVLAYLGMSTSDLERCRDGDPGQEPVCNSVSAADALAAAWHHYLFWILALPLLLLLMPLIHRAVVWFGHRRGS